MGAWGTVRRGRKRRRRRKSVERRRKRRSKRNFENFLFTRRLWRCIEVCWKKKQNQEEIEDKLEMEEKGKDTK